MPLNKRLLADDALQTERALSTAPYKYDRIAVVQFQRASGGLPGKVMAILNTYRQEIRGIVGNLISDEATHYR